MILLCPLMMNNNLKEVGGISNLTKLKKLK